ncbi:MAG: hypothetical protein EBX41_00890 [Chitinophagia bacterium]|nr:hypothetical protein [Chitinophagia bacterium]
MAYYEERLAKLGINANNNVVQLWELNAKSLQRELRPVPIFTKSDKGICILVYNLDRELVTYGKTKSTQNVVNVHKYIKDWLDGNADIADLDISNYSITRLEHPTTNKSGDEVKYMKPKSVPSYPFLPPSLLDKYDSGTPIPVLYLTEGFFKAFKAHLHGIDCVGMQSITCLRNKDTNLLWEDITKIVTRCKVERLVWLTDGDVDSLTTKEITKDTDLFKRPNGFFQSIYTFYELTSDLTDVQRYFAHINTQELRLYSPELSLKGLDDVLVELPEEAAAVKADLEGFSAMAPGKVFYGKYVTKINITFNVSKVRDYLHLSSISDFYKYHVEIRKELKNLDYFTYNGSTYIWDEKECEAVIQIPAAVRDYMRVGNDYYKFIDLPNKSKYTTRKFLARNRNIIIEDHGKDFVKLIAKYEAFTVVPNHVNFEPIINNCYNRYSPFLFEPEVGDCSETLRFLKHLFSTDPVIVENSTATFTCERWELVLDYITLLYRQPVRILPILCLVSKERQTGKTTFGNYLQQLFSGNVINIGNEDLKAEFNSHFADKLCIICDETKIDKHEVVQKIKRMSTLDSIVMNAKGKDQIEVPFFAKFILMSNNTEDFIKIDEQEIRFWVHEVPPLKHVDFNLYKKLIDEIPAFVHLLQTRKMVTEEQERHWFSSKLLATPILEKVRLESQSTVMKNIKIEVASLFDAIEENELKLPLEVICDWVKGQNKSYIAKELAAAGCKLYDKTTVKYPRIILRQHESGYGMAQTIEYTQARKKYYLFLRKDFEEPAAAPADDFSSTPAPVAEGEDDVPF